MQLECFIIIIFVIFIIPKFTTTLRASCGALILNKRMCIFIPAKPYHNSVTVSVHFYHFYCMGICDKLSRHLSMVTYIYLNVDEC